MRVSYVWRLVSALILGFALGAIVMTRILIPHLKPDIKISQIYKRKVKVQDQGTFESTMNVEDTEQDNSETENKKNRVRRRDRK